ncbi:MAG: protease modulator HflC, partial [Chloroflexi bacterium]|nr:protease modulator HflC [Chloroflexota bacterium]
SPMLALVAGAIAAVMLLMQFVFIIREDEQAIVIQFGDALAVIQEPGLHFKAPFIQDVARFDRRVLSRELTPAEYLTLDRKRIVVDHVTRWRIIDPLAFFRTVRDEAGAVARMDDITTTRLRQELSGRDFIPIVRERRDEIMTRVTTGTRQGMEAFGIEVLDVHIRRLDLPAEVQQSVFARMQAERLVLAARFRAEGEEQAREIRARADRDVQIMLATAFATSQNLRGEGDAQAIAVSAQAYGQDQEFYAFVRRLEVYERVLTEGSTLVLRPDSNLFQYLESPTLGR